MRVSLHNSNNLSSTSSLTRGQLSRTGNASPVNQRVVGRTTGFPDSPFISTRPMRYNVQLNEQLTTIQQADSYLHNVENQLLALRQSVTSASELKLQQSLKKLDKLLTKRSDYSGGTVDRQLTAVLGDDKALVNFSLQGIGNVLQKTEGETLIFSLAGTKRDITAVAIREDSSPMQVLHSLNLGLGQFGIHGKFTENYQVVFSVDENQWARVQQHLSVRGEGERYPDGVFYPMKAVAETAPEDVIAAIGDRPGGAKNQLGDIRDILDHVNEQRQRLTRIKENVRSRIDGMASFQDNGAAVDASALLGAQLREGKQNYRTFSQALGGQANVRSLTVRNLLA